MTQFHKHKYIQFLSDASKTGGGAVYESAASQFSHGHNKSGGTEDNPHFKGFYDFSALCAGATIDCAHLLMGGSADVCFNWAGGFHHAKTAEESGFCYVNDLVLGILELLT